MKIFIIIKANGLSFNKLTTLDLLFQFQSFQSFNKNKPQHRYKSYSMNIT